MLTARQRPPGSKGNNRNRNDHIAGIEDLISRATTEDKWKFITQEIAKHKFVPAKLIYSFLKSCPPRFDIGNSVIDLRIKLIKDLRDFILDRLTHKNILEYEGHFAVLMQAGLFYSPEEYFKHKMLVLDAYKAVNMDPAESLKERMDKIESFISRRNMRGAATSAPLNRYHKEVPKR